MAVRAYAFRRSTGFTLNENIIQLFCRFIGILKEKLWTRDYLFIRKKGYSWKLMKNKQWVVNTVTFHKLACSKLLLTKFESSRVNFYVHLRKWIVQLQLYTSNFLQQRYIKWYTTLQLQIYRELTPKSKKDVKNTNTTGNLYLLYIVSCCHTKGLGVVQQI